jgi:hypothetical protein
MGTNQRSKFWLDIILFVGFILTFFLNLTGLELHQWIGVAAGALALYHLVTHWNWVKAVSMRFFGKTTSQARLYYLIDVALFGGFFTIVGTGLVISSWLNLSLPDYPAWRTLHVTASVITLLATALKTVLHWRWIVTSIRSLAAGPAAVQGARHPSLQMAGRRDMLKVMGATGAAVLLALGSSYQSLAGSHTSQASSVSAAASSSQNQTATTASLAQSSSSSAATANTCSARCPRGCSFPGRCRRYTDSNGNNRREMGECP